ncbi:GNAT family N-acetyltransferase [Georgenia sp. 10Sc9-8]|uniref:GNAT family N-acetyltransferase n=1 Tax=Georgenia halotolerans TaxID=3028317 RepID=A0ABT5TZ22_9MICO|nr:GNAT family N-acetyltransferase [Georgenia halotolerans]
MARHGWVTRAGTLERVRFREATAADAPALAELAARTFPLACPPQLPAADVTAFVAEHLSRERMAGYTADGGHLLVVAEREDAPALLGYGLVILPTGADQDPDDADVAAAVRPRPVAELSKCYVEADYQGSGLAVALTERVLADAAAVQVDGTGLAGVWLGTNRDNRRARAFYRKLGFAVTGQRRFRVGERWERDVVMVRDLTPEPDPEVSPR